MSVEFWGGFVAALVILGIIVYALARLGRLPATEKGEVMPRAALEQRLSDLDATVKVLQADHVRDVQRIGQLERELAEAKERIRFLEGQLSQRAPGAPRPARPLVRPLLVVCGDDPTVIGGDLEALDGIGIRYTRLTNADEADVANELGRAREDGRLYRWGLVTAHAGPEGVRLRGQVVPPDFWMRTLAGLEVVGLSACRGTNLADHLRDKVGFVWYFREGVDAELARCFVQKFFQRLNAGEAPETAFVACLDAVPEVAPFADYRCRPA